MGEGRGRKNGEKKTFISIFNFWENGKLIQRQKVHYSATGNKLSCGASKRTPKKRNKCVPINPWTHSPFVDVVITIRMIDNLETI